jgi:RNA 2',3'-cyclic 3'-phosphodiesterase
METYRLFIAAALPPEVKAELADVQDRLGRDRPPVKWVAPASLHLSLKFLGETDADLVPSIGAAMRSALAAHRPAGLHLAGVGAFPNARRPSVIWVGVGGGLAALAQIHADLDAALATLAIPREARRFRAHLTLGRVRREARPEQQERLGRALGGLPEVEPVAWVLDRIGLFRSELHSDGPVYTEIADCRLQIAD